MMFPMTSLHVNRVPPIRATGWYTVAIGMTVAAVSIGALLWSAVNGWVGLAAVLIMAALGGALADRRSHRDLAAFALGAVVTVAGLLTAPLIVAHVYVGALRG